MHISRFIELKGYLKSAKKWYQSQMALMLYHVITFVTWGIFFVTGLLHNRIMILNKQELCLYKSKSVTCLGQELHHKRLTEWVSVSKFFYTAALN